MASTIAAMQRKSGTMSYIAIDTFETIADIIELAYDQLKQHCSPQEFEFQSYGTATIVIDFDDTIASNSETLKQIYSEFPDKKANKRGNSVTINGVSWTLTCKDVIVIMKTLKQKGSKIVIVTSRPPEYETEIRQILEAFGFTEDVSILCTASQPKGPIFRQFMPSLNGGLLFVVDDEERNLSTYVGERPYTAERIFLMKFICHEDDDN